MRLITIAALLSIAAAQAGQIEHIGDTYISGWYESVVVQNNRAYVAEVYGLAALDVTNPNSMLVLDHQPSLGYSYGLDLLGDLTYLGNWEDDLLVINQADPQNLSVIDNVSLPGEVWAVDIFGDIAAVACGSSGVVLLDVSDPENPLILSNFGVNNFVVDIKIHYDWLFIAGWDGGVFSAYIANPQAPQVVGEYTLTLGIVRGLDYAGGFLYLAEENFGLEVLYAGNPANLQWQGALSSSDLFKVRADSNRLYVAAADSGLKIFDISQPDQPDLLYTLPTDGEVWGAFTENNRLWVADGPGGLLVYDIGGGGQPTEIGHHELLGGVVGFARNGDVVYAATKQDGLQVFEILGDSLAWRGEAATADSARSVTLDGPTAYVPCGDAGVHVYNIGSPFAPVYLTTVNTPGFARRMIISGDTGWVADQDRGVAVINIISPGFASLITNINTMNQAMGVAKSGNILYVADRESGLTIYNVANLSVPIILGGLNLPGEEAYDVALYQNFALVAYFEAGLRIVDVTNPSLPSEVAAVPLAGHAERVIVQDHWAFVALHDKGIAVVDLTDPENPVLNAWEETPGSAVDIVPNDLQLLVADTYCAGIYQWDPMAAVNPEEMPTPREFALLEAHPNPFNAGTTLEFNLPRPSAVDLRIYDLSGRQVTQLAAGLFPAGVHQITFHGEALPSGIYLACLEAGPLRQVQKLILLK